MVMLDIVCNSYHPAMAAVALPELLAGVIKQAPEGLRPSLLDECIENLKRAVLAKVEEG